MGQINVPLSYVNVPLIIRGKVMVKAMPIGSYCKCGASSGHQRSTLTSLPVGLLYRTNGYKVHITIIKNGTNRGYLTGTENRYLKQFLLITDIQ